MEEVMELGVTVMAHPTPDQVSANAVEDDVWLRFQGKGYTGIDIFLKPGVADAIIAALQPYATKEDEA